MTTTPLSAEKIKELVHQFFLESFASRFNHTDLNPIEENLSEFVLEAAEEVRSIRDEANRGMYFMPASLANVLKEYSVTDEAHKHLNEMDYQAKLELATLRLNRLTDGPSGLKIRDPFFIPLQDLISCGQLIDGTPSVRSGPQPANLTVTDALKRFKDANYEAYSPKTRLNWSTPINESRF